MRKRNLWVDHVSHVEQAHDAQEGRVGVRDEVLELFEKACKFKWAR